MTLMDLPQDIPIMENQIRRKKGEDEIETRIIGHRALWELQRLARRGGDGFS